MKRLIALTFLALACLFGTVRAENGGYPDDYDPYCPVSELLGQQLSLIIHSPLRALFRAEDGRLLLLALNPLAASMTSASSASIAVSPGSLGSIPGSRYEPGDAGEWNWVFSLSSRYRSVDSDIAKRMTGMDAHLRFWRTDLDAHLIGDRWVLSINVPYRSMEGSGLYEEYSGQSLAIQIVPQYFVLRQDAEGVDLSAFVIGAYECNSFDDDPGIDDPDYASWGAGLLIGKTFDFGDLSLGYTYQPWINVDGDEEVSGRSTVNHHSAALTYTFGLGEGFYGSLKGIWDYAEELPDDFDSDEYLGRGTLGYATECWGIEASYGRTLYSDDYDEWDAGMSVSFRW